MIARDASMCALFILNGVRDHFDTNANFSKFLEDVWQNGCLEFMDQIAEFANLSEKHIEHFAPLFENDGFPGVYHYEVDEAFGVELAKYLEANWDESANMPIHSTFLRHTLERLAARFFAHVVPKDQIERCMWLAGLETGEQFMLAKELLAFANSQD